MQHSTLNMKPNVLRNKSLTLRLRLTGEVALVRARHHAEPAITRPGILQLHADGEQLVANLALAVLVREGPRRLARLRDGAAVERVSFRALLLSSYENVCSL